ncbi:MAG: rod shape-determining protein MreD [Bacteroidales bacterium]|jgi:rod shape-determining protein MreD|nr:rod shape-determining protein MreD [Bacteroidales bacterium]MBQ5857046.1 rod shape-determining protein MreD [Bacteroidales bacterium]
MNNRLILNSLRFIGLLFLQVLVIDNIRLGLYIHPHIYVLFIFLLPFNIPNWQLLFAGFFMGLAVDLFNGTPGLNAAACVFMAFIRPLVINGMMRRNDINENDEPSLNTMGTSRFIVYSLLLLLAHNLILFMLEAFSFKLIGVVFLQTLLSVFSSLLLIFIILLLFKKTKKKLL